MDDVIQTIHPDQDSHFRLRACEADGCGGAAVYVQYRNPGGGECWRVVCTACYEGGPVTEEIFYMIVNEGAYL